MKTFASLAPDFAPVRPFWALAALSFALSLLASPAARAQSTSWTGIAGNENWNDAGNWTFGVPTSADSALIDALPSLLDGGTAEAGGLTLSNAAALTVQNAATGTSGGLTIDTGSDLIIQGASSRWTTTGTAYFAETGSTVRVASGGTLDTGDTALDFGADLTVTGPGSAWTSGFTTLYTGTINLLDGATASTGSTFLATFDDNVITATVGGGVAWTADDLMLSIGTATVDVSDAGQVNVTGSLTAGGSATSVSSIEVTGTGSQLQAATGFTLGEGATATIRDGAALRTATTAGSSNLNGGARLTLDGAGTSWTATGYANVGTNGAGTLDILNGAAATVDSLWTGGNTGASGTVLVDGAGSRLTSQGPDGDLLGFFGASTVTVRNGGRYDSLAITLGELNHGRGTTLTADGAATRINVTNELKIANFGDGTLVVSGGALVTSGSGAVGFGSVNGAGDVVGIATVTGANSRWNIVGSLGIGAYLDNTMFSLGTVTIADGGTIQVGGGTGTVEIDRGGILRIGTGGLAGTLAASSVSFVGATGRGTLAFNHTDNVTFTPSISGRGLLTKAGPGTLVLSGANTFDRGVTISGGTLVAANATGSATGTGLVTVGPDGRLGGAGTIAGPVNVSGVIAPGNSPGTLTTGAQTWNGGGTYQWEITDATGPAGGATGWDLLSINGALTLASTAGSPFTISLTSLLGNGSPGNIANFVDDNFNVYTWTIATANTPVTGFDANAFQIDTAGFTNSFRGLFSVGVSGNDFNLTYTAVPEPETWGVALAILLLGLALWHRRGKRMP